MTDPVKQEFDIVSDWLSAVTNATASSSTQFPISAIRHLGPICELMRGSALLQQVPVFQANLPFETQATRHLKRSEREASVISARKGTGAIGFMSFKSTNTGDAPERLIDFIDNAATQCIAIGISKSIAHASVGSLEEMANNALVHSMRPQSTIIGFRAQKHMFEFVTFDSGIGVLESLKQDGYHDEIKDESEALELAISDGVSRYGPGVGHGNGFRRIFNMPNNHKGYFWLHSGEHALVVDGGTLRRPEAHIRQVNNICGVLASAAFLV